MIPKSLAIARQVRDTCVIVERDSEHSEVRIGRRSDSFSPALVNRSIRISLLLLGSTADTQVSAGGTLSLLIGNGSYVELVGSINSRLLLASC